ncbi:N-acetylneuraminate synthase [Limnobacter sp. SAORIC-690]|uniref:N-acetylneuraminate synthase n=1 Tax=Limnobacter sp. SAORIC-690 TaxID=1923970 RepID=UPI000CF50251|nr:N-acetylneuraminate synthase [Limnobacter sp. SAORIC-690]PQJ24052.1 N-acetylneuraminate synthase [Limnobacter sp. SAORIC-690]
MRTLIIAEAGVNHNGQIELAKRLIAEAALAGADLVKFQSFITSKSISLKAPKAEYQKATTAERESQYEMVKKLELTRADHEILIEECRRYKIGFFSTAFDEESFNMLRELGIDQVKIPSGELTNLPLIRYMTQFGMPVILSTGMANLGEIEATIEAIEKAGTPRSRITVLHCNTEYPTPMADVNLRAMVNMKRALGVEVGYSDHTHGIEIPIAAVALGARIIEKHFTLDRNLPGPDHKASLEPHQLKAMIEGIRNIEVALGDGIKRPSTSEFKNKPIARKSIVAAKEIKAGDLLTEDNLAVKRPGTGISPMQWDLVIGRTAKRNFGIDELIDL